MISKDRARGLAKRLLEAKSQVKEGEERVVCRWQLLDE